MKESRVVRLFQILTALQSGEYNTIDELVKVTRRSRRTVFRDLKALEEGGLCLERDHKTGRYILDNNNFLPPLDLNPQEALTLLLLLQEALSLPETPFKHSAVMASTKLRNSLSERIRRHCNSLLKKVHIIKPPVIQSKKDFDYIFDILQKAITKRRVVSLTLLEDSNHQEEATLLCPYNLVHKESTWFILGRTPLRNAMRYIRMSRIKHIRMLDKGFVEDPDFDVAEYIGRAWSMLPEGTFHHIRLRFAPEVAQDVAEVQWHKSQTVTWNEDGSAIIEFRVDGMKEITPWILGYGQHVEVMEPIALRRRIAEIAAKLSERYREIPAAATG